MIITRTPFRISFGGGGSDFEAFYRQWGGAVLSTTINKYMYLSSHHFFDEEKIRVKYSKTETVDRLTDLEHPILREVLTRFRITGALEISSNADVPAGSGLGSSSSFTVGLLHNLYTRCGKHPSNARLAEEACDVEIRKLQEPIGKQDQYAAAFGGLNMFHFNPSGPVEVEPMRLNRDVYRGLQDNLLMFHTGKQRMASSILAEQQRNLQGGSRIDTLKEMVDLAWEMRESLHERNLEHFGLLLDQGWRLKQRMASTITNDFINDFYERGLRNGALGGKLLGAGGGGFLLFYSEKADQERLRQAMHPLQEMKFAFETEGSKVIYIGDEGPAAPLEQESDQDLPELMLA